MPSRRSTSAWPTTKTSIKANNTWKQADFAAKAPGLDWAEYFRAAGLGRPSKLHRLAARSVHRGIRSRRLRLRWTHGKTGWPFT